jgi:hypothetical protein
MTMQDASMRLLSLVLGTAAAALVLGLGARSAHAQLAVPSCIAPDDVPEAVFNAIDDEYPLDTFSPATCRATAKAASQGCKKAVTFAARCRNLVNQAVTQASLLACAELTDSSARKACESDAENELKSLQSDVKDEAKQGSAGCADDLPAAIQAACNPV